MISEAELFVFNYAIQDLAYQLMTAMHKLGAQ
jgi:hypothetical protein